MSSNTGTLSALIKWNENYTSTNGDIVPSKQNSVNTIDNNAMVPSSHHSANTIANKVTDDNDNDNQFVMIEPSDNASNKNDASNTNNSSTTAALPTLIITPITAAPAIPLEDKILNAVEALAIYFNVQFPLTPTETTATGTLENYVPTPVHMLLQYAGYFQSSGTVQGLYKKRTTYDPRWALLNKTIDAVISINVEMLTENEHQRLGATLQGFQAEVSGTRFPALFNAWINLYDKTDLAQAKKFVSVSQALFKQCPIHMDSLEDALDEINGVSTEHTEKDKLTLEIQGQVYRSLFDALGHRAVINAQHRPADIRASKDLDYRMAELLTHTHRQELNPLPNDEYKILYATLELYEALHAIIYKAELKTDGTQANPESFQEHCVFIKAALLTLANNGTEQAFWKNVDSTLHPSEWQLKAAVTARYKKLQMFSVILHPNTETAATVFFDIETHITSFFAANSARDESAKNKLMARLCEYTEGLGAQLKKSLKEPNRKSAVSSDFHPDLALECITQTMAYAISPKASASRSNSNSTASEADSTSTSLASSTSSLSDTQAASSTSSSNSNSSSNSAGHQQKSKNNKKKK